MFSIDRRSRVPVFEQIKNEIMTLIRLGVLGSDEKLPSIRAVSSETGVNVNTVKKAFSELENAGVIYSVAGLGSFVSENALKSEDIRKDAFTDISNAVCSAKSRGIKKEEIIGLVNSIYEKEE